MDEKTFKKIRTIFIIIVVIIIFLFLFISSARSATKKTAKIPYANIYARELCKNPDFDCASVPKNIRWEKFWPDEKERLLIMKLNRMNVLLKAGMIVAIPKNLKNNLMDFSPFPKTVKKPEEKFVIFNPTVLAWGAYDKNGKLVRWGPALGGADWCRDIHRKCRTITGNNFRVNLKGNANSRSGAYPIGCGSQKKPCARMPWVMYFYKHLYGIHGSDMMVGYNASHGCVRTFSDDAEWLSKNFVEIETKVIVNSYPYPNPNK